ncbi:hypothetical protein ACM55I_09595 [Flavobacterium sp. GB2R13]|uniref:hypothetical protein n=1 Tax=Flavobacterium algoris TaxID=3398733 RepID=UPI003A84AC0A
MKQNYFLKAAGIVAILVLMSNQVTAQSTSDVSQGTMAVKVIDNKGTIKYFQSNNGITQIVNATDDVTTTTWQLGGILTDKTYIDTNGKEFGLAGLAITGSSASDGTSNGYTLLVNNSVTGKVERLLASSLIQGGVAEKVLAADQSAAYVIAAAALTGLTTEKNRISLFRNGIKLRQSDWTLSGGAITITPTTDLPLFLNDVLEIQWVK